MARSATAEAVDGHCSWWGSPPALTTALAASAALRASATVMSMASPSSYAYAAAPSLAGRGIYAFRLIAQRPERALAWSRAGQSPGISLSRVTDGLSGRRKSADRMVSVILVGIVSRLRHVRIRMCDHMCIFCAPSSSFEYL